jgi:hypothetical protein
MPRLEDKISAIRNEEASGALSRVQAIQEQKGLVETGMLLGATSALRNLASSMTTQAIRALQHFRDTKQHEKLGYTRFDDFLNKYTYSPMTYKQFNEREKILALEGDAAFDLLNDLQVPLQARKLLSAGTVRVEGDEIIIGRFDEGHTVSVASVKDRTRIAEIIKTLANENEANTRVITDQREKIKKGSQELKKARKALDDAVSPYAQAPYEKALFTVIGAFSNLCDELEELLPHERKEKRDYTFKQISDQRLRLEELFDVKAPKLSAKERAAGLSNVIDELNAEEM